MENSTSDRMVKKEGIIIKKEKGEIKTENYLNDFINNPDYSDFLREYAHRRLNYSRTSYFNSIKNDLNTMIKENRIMIYSSIAVNRDNFTKRAKLKDDSYHLLQFYYSSIEFNRKCNLTKTIYPNYNEESYYVWFLEINRAISTDCNAFNKIESAEIKKLINKVESQAISRFDKYTESFLVESGIVSGTVIEEILDLYKNKKEPYIIEWLDRKMTWVNPFTDKDGIYKSFVADLEYMIEKKYLALPLSLNILKDGVNNKFQLVFNKKIDNIDTVKNMTINLLELNENELKRIWVILFDFLNFVYSERITESQYYHLKKLIDEMYIISNIDKYSENYLVEHYILPKSVVGTIKELYDNQNFYIVDWLERRLELRLSNDRDIIFGHFIAEIERMISLKCHLLPINFKIDYDSKGKSYQLGFNRKINGKLFNKYVSINLIDLDKFECFRMWELIFEWMTKVFSVILSPDKRQILESKVNILQEIISNHEGDDDV